MPDRVHHVFLVPGMFGFGKLAGYDYFEHIERHLAKHFERAGVRYVMEIVPTPPTASIRRRARVVAAKVAETAGKTDARIHIVGHSTGGLDARLIAAPTSNLNLDADQLRWKDRLESILTLNTPHHGTPLATFFTSVSGVRLLYALSLLTFTTLRYGGPPLTVFSSLVAALSGIDDAVGIDIKLLDRTTDLLLRFVGTQGRDEVRVWLDGIRKDQGGIVQLTPEAMDVFNATTEDSERVRYGCIATAAPPPSPVTLAMKVRSPYAALTATIYSTLWTIASREHAHYPCPPVTDANRGVLEEGCGGNVTGGWTDGIVPTLSMLHGALLWAGRADHLDVVGHFRDEVKPPVHTDWLHSGSNLTRREFGEAMERIASFLLASPRD